MGGKQRKGYGALLTFNSLEADDAALRATPASFLSLCKDSRRICRLNCGHARRAVRSQVKGGSTNRTDPHTDPLDALPVVGLRRGLLQVLEPLPACLGRSSRLPQDTVQLLGLLLGLLQVGQEGAQPSARAPVIDTCVINELMRWCGGG
jgi:hypothetical protein